MVELDYTIISYFVYESYLIKYSFLKIVIVGFLYSKVEFNTCQPQTRMAGQDYNAEKRADEGKFEETQTFEKICHHLR